MGKGDKNYSGHGIIVKSTKTQAVIFDNNFITIDSNTRIHKLQATKTDKTYLERKISLSNISFSKMMNLIKGKVILYFGIKGDCNLVYKQDGKIIRGKILNLEHVYNPSISMENLNYGSCSYDIDRKIKTIEDQCKQATLSERETLTKELQKLKKEKSEVSNSISKAPNFDVEIIFLEI